MQIDSEKLQKVISSTIKDNESFGGMCTEGRQAIGKIGKWEIQIVITCDEGDYLESFPDGKIIKD